MSWVAYQMPLSAGRPTLKLTDCSPTLTQHNNRFRFTFFADACRVCSASARLRQVCCQNISAGTTHWHAGVCLCEKEAWCASVWAGDERVADPCDDHWEEGKLLLPSTSNIYGVILASHWLGHCDPPIGGRVVHVAILRNVWLGLNVAQSMKIGTILF